MGQYYCAVIKVEEKEKEIYDTFVDGEYMFVKVAHILENLNKIAR